MSRDRTLSDKRTASPLPKKRVPEVLSRRTVINQSEGREPAPKNEFRERLIARLDQAEVPAHKRMMYVAELTGRAVQTVSRWFDADQPGLPDLQSYARLCEGLHCNADWMLGLSTTPNRTAMSQVSSKETSARWMIELLDEISGDFHDCEPIRMSGDEMAPRIRDGDHMFVSRGTEKVFGNGIYVIEWQDRQVVRNVENRIGQGVVLSCENPQYAECLVKDAATARRMGLRVVGKVAGIIRAVHFWAH